jgi:DNA-binding transcriptional ArsR family regulator
MKRAQPDFLGPAELIGHPARSAMLDMLLDGRELPMSMLASEAGVAPSTASEHLAKLTAGGLVRVVPRGRRRCFTIASRDVARALEALSGLAPASTADVTDRPASALHLARTCYDHLAGSLGVAVTASLIGAGVLTPADDVLPDAEDRGPVHTTRADGARITSRGRRLLRDFGVRLPPTRRRLVSYCMDWSGQRYHLGGALGAALLRRFQDLGWLRAHHREARALVVTDVGRRGFTRAFGIDTAQLLRTHVA